MFEAAAPGGGRLTITQEQLAQQIVAGAELWDAGLAGRATIEILIRAPAGDEAGGVGRDLASTRPTIYASTGAEIVDGYTVVHPGPLVELLTGVDPNGPAADIEIVIDPARMAAAVYGAGGIMRGAPPGPNTIDVGLWAHEIGHGLGILGFRDHAGALGGGQAAGAVPAISRFDQYVAIDDSGHLVFVGPHAMAAYGDGEPEPVPLGPDPYHVDVPGDLMVRGIKLADQLAGIYHPPSDVDFAILQDLGYPLE